MVKSATYLLHLPTGPRGPQVRLKQWRKTILVQGVCSQTASEHATAAPRHSAQLLQNAAGATVAATQQSNVPIEVLEVWKAGCSKMVQML